MGRDMAKKQAVKSGPISGEGNARPKNYVSDVGARNVVPDIR